MIFVQKYRLSQVKGDLRAFADATAQMIDELGQVVNRVHPDKPVTGNKTGNLDGVWLVAQFAGAATAITFQHTLGRVPVLLMEAKTVPDVGETVADGEVRMVSATATTVTLQCAGANKRARLLLL